MTTDELRRQAVEASRYTDRAAAIRELRDRGLSQVDLRTIRRAEKRRRGSVRA